MHLQELGHSKIAFLNGSLHSMITECRQEAFYDSMEAHGLEVDQEMVANGYYVAESANVSSNSTASYHDPSGKGRAWKMWLYGIAFPDESCVYQ